MERASRRLSWRPSLTALAGYDYLDSFEGRDEHRPWPTAHHAVHRGGFRLVHRLRLDERFVQGVDPVVARLRYRLSTTQNLWNSDWYTRWCPTRISTSTRWSSHENSLRDRKSPCDCSNARSTTPPN